MSYEGKELGKLGEDLAEAFLVRKGYRILCRNYRTKQGEIDIIALDGETTVFVEVKSFGTNSWTGVSPAVNVTAAKRKQIIHTARVYLAQLGREPYCRFDVIAVVTAPEQTIEHFEGAFST